MIRRFTKDQSKKQEKLADAAREAGKGHICVNQIGSLMSVFFTDQKVRDFESAVTSNTEQYADYFGYLLDRGILYCTISV